MPLTSALLASSTSNSNNILKTQPVCHLYETDGSTWKDITTNNNSLELYNLTTSSNNIIFDGSTSYGYLLTFTKTLASNLSIFVWIKTTSTNAYILQTGGSPLSTANEGVFMISSGKLNFWDWNNSI